MKKLLYFFLISLFFVACEDDDKIIEVPTTVYEKDKLDLKIEGVNNELLVNPSVAFTEATVVLNNIIYPKSSFKTSNNSVTGFSFRIETDKEISDLKGEVTNGVLKVTGSVRYNGLGISREYLGKTLIVNGKPAADKTSAEIQFTGTKDKPNTTILILKGLLEGSEDDSAAFKLEGTLIEGTNNVFDLVASGKDKKIEVKVTGTFSLGILSITIETSEVPETPEVEG